MSLSDKEAIAHEYGCLLIAFILLAIRIYTRAWLQSKFTSADVFLIAAWCFFAANNAADTVNMSVGMLNPNIPVSAEITPDFREWVEDDEEKLKSGLVAMFLSAIFYFSCMFFVKFSFLSLYYTLIPASFRRLRFALNLTTVITVCGYAMMLGVNLFWCHPISLNFEPDVEKGCYAVLSVTPYVTTLGFHVISDILIYILPFFLLPTLRKGNGPLWGLVTIFSLGFLSITVTLIRAVYVANAANFALMGVLAAVEQLVAILVACSPSLKWLWKSFKLVRLDSVGAWVNRRRRVDEEGYDGDDEGDRIGFEADEQGKESDDEMTRSGTRTTTTTLPDLAVVDERSHASGIVVIGALPPTFDEAKKS